MTYAKAIAAFFTSLGTWGATALADGRMDPAEWFGVCGIIVATAAVWGFTNKRSDESGQALLWAIVGALVAIVLLALFGRLTL